MAPSANTPYEMSDTSRDIIPVKRVSALRLRMDAAVFAQEIQDMRTSTVLCDVVLKGSERWAEGIRCHRLVLCAHSVYFRAMFTVGLRECHQEEVQLQNIPSDILKSLINYCYSSEISTDEDNVELMLTTALFLVIPPIAERCWQFLERRLDETNCLKLYNLPQCEMHQPKLAENVKAMMLRHFQTICHSPAFLELNKDKVTELISSDDLYVDREEEALHAVIRWLDHDIPNRRPHFYEIIQHIRQAFLSPAYLHAHLVAFLNAVKDSPVHEKLHVESYLHEIPNRTEEAILSQNRSRKFYGMTKVIVCVGGEAISGGSALDCVDCFEPANLIWSVWKRLSYKVYGAGLVNVDDQYLFLCGGYNPLNGRYMKRVSRYNPNLDKWDEMADLQTERVHPGVAVLNGYVYALGGRGGNRETIQTMERYDPATNQWQYVASLPISLSRFAAVACKGRLYTFGGFTSAGIATNSSFCYDTSTDSWSEVARIPTPRYFCSACVGPSGLIYVIGGTNAFPVQNNLSCVEAYDVCADAWLANTSMNKRRRVAGTVCVDGKIYALGGFDDGYDNSMEIYEEKTDTWSIQETRMLSARSAFGCVAIRVKKG
ncbi:kelch-like protein 5 [Paramacrobiotus metropolitanus]|uniref:kelch-like protein 5 n=1 Tax=Paramacrobiotus metropolitanus TaxID=2943436 RepID=UPI0024457FEF|nr:kelch-like protein 5 [Paramacrobiotus metropolitanus]